MSRRAAFCYYCSTAAVVAAIDAAIAAAVVAAKAIAVGGYCCCCHGRWCYYSPFSVAFRADGSPEGREGKGFLHLTCHTVRRG